MGCRVDDRLLAHARFPSQRFSAQLAAFDGDERGNGEPPQETVAQIDTAGSTCSAAASS